MIATLNGMHQLILNNVSFQNMYNVYKYLERALQKNA